MDFYLLLKLLVKISVVNIVKNTLVMLNNLVLMLKDCLKKTIQKTADGTIHLAGSKIPDKIAVNWKIKLKLQLTGRL